MASALRYNYRQVIIPFKNRINQQIQYPCTYCTSQWNIYSIWMNQFFSVEESLPSHKIHTSDTTIREFYQVLELGANLWKFWLFFSVTRRRNHVLGSSVNKIPTSSLVDIHYHTNTGTTSIWRILCVVKLILRSLTDKLDINSFSVIMFHS